MARALAGDPAAGFALTTTGPHDLPAFAVRATPRGLDGRRTDRIGSLDGVDRVATVLVTRYAKRAAAASQG
ncbi:hypothetical protein [Streptomyces sp. NPDC018031]|uniref:hypothetical protein n=1 Tax=Streptomyces sp. NPDC018031 TaxID=3365033 RepID=UPI0037925160